MGLVDVLMSLFGYARMDDNKPQNQADNAEPKVVYCKRGAESANSSKKFFSTGDARPSVLNHLAYFFSDIWAALADVMRPTAFRKKSPEGDTRGLAAAMAADVTASPHYMEARSVDNEISGVSDAESNHKTVLKVLVSFYEKTPNAEFNGTDEFKTWAKDQIRKSDKGEHCSVSGQELSTLRQYLGLNVWSQTIEKKDSPIAQVEKIDASESANDIDNIIPEKSAGQREFEEFLEEVPDFERLELHQFNTAYVFTKECYEYSQKVQSEILDRKNNRFSSDERRKLNACSIIADKYHRAENLKKELAQLEQERTEKMRAAAERAAKQPGQADFEDFLRSYSSAADEGREMTLYANGKYFGPECLAYASSQRNQKTSKSAVEHLLGAATTFGKWPVDDGNTAKLPPPPPPPPRAGATPKPVPATISASFSAEQRAAMASLITRIKQNIRLITQHTDMTVSDIWYALEALVIATENESVAAALQEDVSAEWKVIKEGVTRSSRQENYELYDIETPEEKLNKAMVLINEFKRISEAVHRPPSAALSALAKSVTQSAARNLIEKNLAKAQKEAAQAYAFELKSMKELSEQESAIAQQRFSDYAVAIERSQQIGNSDQFFEGRQGSQYLEVLCLSYANHMAAIYGTAGTLVDADQRTLLAAGFLLNEFNKRKQAALLS